MTTSNLIEVIPRLNPCDLGQAAWAPASDATCTTDAAAPTLLQFMHPDAITISPVIGVLVLLLIAVLVLSDLTQPSHQSR